MQVGVNLMCLFGRSNLIDIANVGRIEEDVLKSFVFNKLHSQNVVFLECRLWCQEVMPCHGVAEE
jgi:hypothetical protein